MLADQPQIPHLDAPAIALRDLDTFYLADEAAVVTQLLERARVTPDMREAISAAARILVQGVRERHEDVSGLHAFLHHYDLSSQEGVMLMCLAESLLRIPDAATADKLIADKLTSADWRQHLGGSQSLFVNASTWALMLTGNLIELSEEAQRQPGDFLARLAGRMEEPVIRAALKTAMHIMAQQFVMSRDIAGALARASEDAHLNNRYSFDMLGEAALTSHDAERYSQAYTAAIEAIGAATDHDQPMTAQPSISVKLSALSPRFEYAQRQRAVDELSTRVKQLAVTATKAEIGLTLDAEEADRLCVSLEIFENVYCDTQGSEWSGLGLAVQAYQKRAIPMLRWLQLLAARMRRVIPVRLVKGAYWDTEIKRAQEQGLEDYPVFTRKSNTDVSYLACARFLLDECPDLYPQFATHNAQTIAYVHLHAEHREFEFQRLHGMGEELYDAVHTDACWDRPLRVYAPVGAHEDLLPYLVRRLLENGANTSFVNQIADTRIDIEDIIADPIDHTVAFGDDIRRHDIPLPRDLFGARKNSKGINFADANALRSLSASFEALKDQHFSATAIVGKQELHAKPVTIVDPAARGRVVGTVEFADADQVPATIGIAQEGFALWNAVPAAERADALERTAERLEERYVELTYLCVREAGKTLRDAHADMREAVDFLRYYAQHCRQQFATPTALPGPTGERNELSFTGRGVFVCISPWNFPVAIYTGQIAAALAAGNSVVAKPAEQTCLIAALITELFHDAGVPPAALAFMPGDGAIGEALVKDPGVDGVAFTGSTDTAQRINRTLAARNAPIAALIAETGGLNTMIADSSALPEQLVTDVIESAFNSAGQRCSALRVLYVQDDIAVRTIELLEGAMDEVVIGDPLELTTDIGPVIDGPALERLEAHLASIAEVGRVLHRCRDPDSNLNGFYFAPTLVEIDGIERLEHEVFGPILHLVRYRSNELDHVIAAINARGYGLTVGIHSRIETQVEYIRQRIRAGNCYVNRNMIGAVVGSQPFGGMGLSGTGPKAGGPHYLLRFATEKTYTVNSAAVGGNATLLNLAQEQHK